ncbi:MAG: hypothetical protein WCF18_22450 [Chthoniobacteraceae bacterium]
MPLNRARGVLERVAFLCYLALLIGSCGLVGLGLIFALHLREPRPVLYGLAGVIVVAVLREHGYRHWHFRDWEESFEPVDAGGVVLDAAGLERVEEFERLLRELTAIEEGDAAQQRDIWAVQELRSQAKALLAQDPSLRETCAAALGRHPDVG